MLVTLSSLAYKQEMHNPTPKGWNVESFQLTSDDECESLLLGKMIKSPFTGTCERGEGLFDLIHKYVCGPFRTATRDAN